MSEEWTKGLVMKQNIEASMTTMPMTKMPMTFEDYGNNNAMPSLDASEELDWLMSLALDDALDAREAERFELLLREQPANLDRWVAWQTIDTDFQQMPCVMPSLDFCDKFAQRLEFRERQRRLRTGVIFGLAAVMLWGSALVGAVMLGALMWSNEGAWLGGVIANLSYWRAAVGQFGQALLNTGEALLSAPEARLVVACYIALAVAILAGWFIFLRRSLREMPLTESSMAEA